MSLEEKVDLKLLAFDPEDLDIVSAHLQDAVISVGEMTYHKSSRRFAAVVNRFDWAQALSPLQRVDKPYLRRRTALRFEHVMGAQILGIDLSDKRQTLSILALTFETINSPGGFVTITCAGNASIKLHVECLEAELRDLGAAWATARMPDHTDQKSKPPSDT